MIIVSRIIHFKVDRRLNVTNKFKYQRRLSSRLPIVMFRGTPCIKLVKDKRISSLYTVHYNLVGYPFIWFRSVENGFLQYFLEQTEFDS